eukprot:jgi/Ulvmu1/6856/UM031_0061.1
MLRWPPSLRTCAYWCSLRPGSVSHGIMQSMHNLAAALAVGSVLFVGQARACSFDTLAAQVPVAAQVLRVPLSSSGAEAQDACAAIASAYGYAAASVQPAAEGQKTECTVHDVGQQCVKFELQAGTTTMTNIAGCDAATITGVTNQGVNLIQTVGTPTVLGTVSASKRADVAAVGGAVGQPLKTNTEEECLFACVSYVDGCETVTTGAVNESVECTFHNSEATTGVAAVGSNTYDTITTTRGTPALGRLAGARAAPVAEVAPMEVPLLAPIEAPLEVPVSAPIEAPVEAPEVVAEPVVAPVEAPEEVEVVGVPAVAPEEEEAEVPEEDAEVPEEDAEVPGEIELIEEAAGTLEQLITTQVGECGPVMSEIPTGKHLPTLKAPQEAVEYYGDLLKDGEFPMSYGEIQNGGEYCVAPGSTAPKVIFGGMMFWNTGGECYLPPTKDDGSACCEMFMWQPNTEGYYYDNCSMKMVIDGSGLWWFTTEMPGDESKVGWGPDPAPHIHYDIRCSGCGDTDAFSGNQYQYWSKFYALEVCTLDPCGAVNEAEHMSEEITGPEGETVFRYNFVLPPDSKGKF